MEGSKNLRRKRKDPESRDFKCVCDKSYLSYAAAYTHVKNKHQGKKQYLKRIQKPERQSLKRGRPILKKPLEKTTSTQALSVVEQAILQIYEHLKLKYDQGFKIILQGNDETQNILMGKHFEELINQNKVQLNIFDEEIDDTNIKRIRKFQSELNKHFQAIVAAKIKFYLNYLLRKYQWQQMGWKKPNREEITNLWDEDINSIIEQAYLSWNNINNHEKLSSNQSQPHQPQQQS